MKIFNDTLYFCGMMIIDNGIENLNNPNIEYNQYDTMGFLAWLPIKSIIDNQIF